MAGIRVRAIRPGFYGGHRRRAGAEFSVQSEADLGAWMERVDRAEVRQPATKDAAAGKPAERTETRSKQVI